jgi:diguanylate cyclase (GGDEF)-like protein
MDTVTDPNALNWLGVPLESSGDIIGALVVQNHADNVRYTDQDRELLQFVATQVAAAVERKKMHARLEHMAQHDQLTGLPNRTLFLDHLHSALARAHREKTSLAVLYLDLDDFKQVNDIHGHTVGDQLLQEMARRMTRCVRESDTVGRIGGDEFIVLLDGIRQPGDADMVTGKILAALSAPYEHPRATLRVTASIGVALYPEHGRDGDELIQHADNAMYQAKKGRLQPDPAAR